MSRHRQYSYWRSVWQQFKKHRLGYCALIVVIGFCLMGIYAPFLASSKPVVVYFEGEWYFPLFRYLFYQRFFSKRLDLFYNLLMFTLPLLILSWYMLKHHRKWFRFAISAILIVQCGLFLYLAYRKPVDPGADHQLTHKRQAELKHIRQLAAEHPLWFNESVMDWDTNLTYLSPYAKLNLVLRYKQRKEQQQQLSRYANRYAAEAKLRGSGDLHMPTLWQMDEDHLRDQKERLDKIIAHNASAYPEAKLTMDRFHAACKAESSLLPPWMICNFLSHLPPEELRPLMDAKRIVQNYQNAQSQIKYINDKQEWLDKQAAALRFDIMPMIRPFHWEDDAGGNEMLNKIVGWCELTRINRKDLVSALIFGTRISISVGILAVGLALLIGIPIGAFSGYYGGKIDMVTYRLIEIWESMPTFFMLLMVVAFLQSKSIFLVIAVIGLFGWTNFSRYVRGEFFKQKQLPYVEACHAMGFKDRYIMFSHLLPNAIPPLLTLVPFAMMGAITSEAGLSFLGLGEENSCSWGVLMDEGRNAFPNESYLLWPPAIMLTILLVAIALVGDALRDALDPKLRKR